MALMISQGIPMLLMGDEYGHSKDGNNNSWCQDNALNWQQWGQENSFYRFYKLMVQFRKRHPSLRQTHFLTPKEIDWHGKEPLKPNWSSTENFIAFTLKATDPSQTLYIAFNAQGQEVKVHLPQPPKFKTWRWIANTANPSPKDFFGDGEGPLQVELQLSMPSYSSLILKAQ